MKKFSTLDKVVVGASVLAVIALFLPWYGFSSSFGSDSVSGFSTGFFGWFGSLLIIASGGYLVAVRSGVDLSGVKFPPGRVVFVLSLVGVLLVGLRWLTIPSGGVNYGTVSYHYGPEYGMIIMLILGVVQAVSAFRLPGSHSSTATTTA
jgi:hypothetical protein